MIKASYKIEPIGTISSELVSCDAAPHQGNEGAPDAWLEVNTTVAGALEGITPGDEIVVITWFHKAHRDILKLHGLTEQKNKRNRNDFENERIAATEKHMNTVHSPHGRRP